ncbi:MAG: hypothetical protein ACE5GQ_06600 [Nitrospinales bacterium]
MKASFQPISKRSIFVTAVGRSATGFLAQLLSRTVDDCHGVHEPDVLYLYRILGVVKDDAHVWQKIRGFGLFNMTLGKLIPQRNTRGLSLAVQRGAIDQETAALNLYKIRRRYVLKLKESIYAECNPQLGGLLDIIPLVFPNSKTVYLIRDGRNWVRSFLNRAPTLFGKKDILSCLPNARPRADLFPEDPFFRQWEKFSQFQCLCWLWHFRVEHALKAIDRNPHARVIKYEDLFEGPNTQETMEDMLKFLTAFPDGFQAKFKYDNKAVSGQKIGESQYNIIPSWKSWTPERVKEFQDICGDLMTRLGYAQEPQWLELVHHKVHT